MKKSFGFTVIELMIVLILLIGVFGLFIFPIMNRTIHNAGPISDNPNLSNCVKAGELNSQIIYKCSDHKLYIE
jgi:Tfp pilus assembly protein FimT